MAGTGNDGRLVSCASCRFFDGLGGDAIHGLCRRNSPVPRRGEYQNTFWPMVSPKDDWCGEHAKRLA